MKTAIEILSKLPTDKINMILEGMNGDDFQVTEGSIKLSQGLLYELQIRNLKKIENENIY